ncbi:hypothetical protein Tco_0530524 [Tanacetum coccineum]
MGAFGVDKNHKGCVWLCRIAQGVCVVGQSSHKGAFGGIVSPPRVRLPVLDTERVAPAKGAFGFVVDTPRGSANRSATSIEQMLLAVKDEAGSNLSNKENDFMFDTSYGEDLEELTAAAMLMARIQPADENVETVPSYDAKAFS